MKLKNSWFTDLKNKRRDRENQDCTIFCPHVSLCVFSPQHFFFCFFFCIFMSFLFFVFLVALGNFVFAVTHCRTPTQKKKNTVIRERQILLYSDFLSVCMTRGTVTQTNPIIITWKRRESEKKKWQKQKKNREAALLAKTWRFLNRSKRIRSTGRVLLVRSVIPLVPPSDAGFCNRRVN